MPSNTSPRLRDEWLDQLDGVRERITRVDIAHRVRHPAASDSREVEDFGDEEGQVLLIGFHAREVGVLILGHRPAQTHVEQIDVAPDGVERRSQLMAHRGEKCGLGHVRRFSAPPEDEREVMDLRVVEGKRASRSQVLGELHVLRHCTRPRGQR